MYEQVEKPKGNNSKAVANSVAQKKSDGKQGFRFVDNRVNIIQRAIITDDGPNNFLQNESEEKMESLFDGNTWILIKTLRNSGADFQIMSGGSPTYDHKNRRIELPEGWLRELKSYCTTGQKTPNLGQAIAGLTHEMSHAHDHVMLKDRPMDIEDKPDDYVIGVLRTEMKAWMKEARSWINHMKKGIEINEEGLGLIDGWLKIQSNGLRAQDMGTRGNIVIERLDGYFNSNKKGAKTSLTALFVDSKTGLYKQITELAGVVKVAWDNKES
jgi:hypothetical protein